MNILFWNLNNKDLSWHIAQLLEEHCIDVAVFAEHRGVDFTRLSSELHSYDYVQDPGGCDKIAVISRQETKLSIPGSQDRYAICSFLCEGSCFVLAGAHLPDRRNYSASYVRIESIRRLKVDLEEQGDLLGTSRLIVIGDFNADPFDVELLQPDAFSAVPFKEVMHERPLRVIQGIEYRHLYNPIPLSLSEGAGMYGSYYFSNDDYSQYWHCLDQVLVSEVLTDEVRDDRYLKCAGGKSLMKNSRPDVSISDHLPLLVSFGGRSDGDE